jgi:hypothetical protein
MNDLNPLTAFRGLPLTPDQEREIEHYIRTRERRGVEWNTPELRAMIDDMLNPPEVDDDDGQSLDDSMAAERSTFLGEEPQDEDSLPSERDPHRHHAHD